MVSESVDTSPLRTYHAASDLHASTSADSEGYIRVPDLLAIDGGVPWTAPAADAEPHTQRTYYVDSELGKDTNDGLSDASPWQSLQQVNTADLHPGDTVRFKRGGVWRGTPAASVTGVRTCWCWRAHPRAAGT